RRRHTPAVRRPANSTKSTIAPHARNEPLERFAAKEPKVPLMAMVHGSTSTCSRPIGPQDGQRHRRVRPVPGPVYGWRGERKTAVRRGRRWNRTRGQSGPLVLGWTETHLVSPQAGALRTDDGQPHAR